MYCLFCPKEFFLNICLLSQCIVYWTHIQNIHPFAYQKTLLHILFCLFLKSSKAFSVSLRLHWKKKVGIELLKAERRKSEKITALSLIIFGECLYLDLLLPNLSLNFLKKFVRYLNAKRRKGNPVFCCILLLFWVWYFTMDLITGSLMLSEIGSQLAYSGILRLLTILEKKVSRICAVLISLSTISSYSIKVSFSLDTILSDKNGSMVFQKLLLSVNFLSSRLL